MTSTGNIANNRLITVFIQLRGLVSSLLNPVSFFKKNWDFIFTYLLFFLDIVFLNIAFYTAIHLRFPNFPNHLAYWEPWLIANIIFFPLSVFLGLYRGVFKSSLENQKSQLEKLAFYMAVFLMAYLYITKGSEYSRGVVIIFLMTMYVMMQINHGILSSINRILVKRGLGSKNTLIIGTDYSAKEFAERLQDIYGHFYKIVGFIDKSGDKEYEHRVEPILGVSRDTEELIEKYKIHQVFIVSDSMDLWKYTTVRKACEKKEVYLKMVSPYIKNLIKKRKIKDITGVPLTTDTSRPRYNYWQTKFKRLTDLIFLLSTSFITIPVCLITGTLIKLSSPGPVFFKQKRALQKNGNTFWFYKFRTMKQDADEIKDELLEENETNGALFKMKDDPRVTPVGKFIRKFSIDEFAQFINVLKGEMSVVGPRPLPIQDFKMVKNGKVCYDWYKKRDDAKPGITGLWQISGRSDLSFEEMCLLDLYYIENQSLFFDLEIMFETISVMLFGKGAY